MNGRDEDDQEDAPDSWEVQRQAEEVAQQFLAHQHDALLFELSHLVQCQAKMLADQQRALVRHQVALLISQTHGYGDQEVLRRQIQTLKTNIARLIRNREEAEQLLGHWGGSRRPEEPHPGAL